MEVTGCMVSWVRLGPVGRNASPGEATLTRWFVLASVHCKLLPSESTGGRRARRWSELGREKGTFKSVLTGDGEWSLFCNWC